MTTITKEQLTQIIQNAPAGTTPTGIINGLKQKGYQLEGYPTPQQENALRATAAQNADNADKQKGVIQKVGDFLGISKFGEGIGTAINNMTGGLKPLEQAQAQLLDESKRLTSAYQTAKANGADTSRLLKAMKQNADALSTLADNYQHIGTGDLSTKEILGSAALTLGNIVLAGAGSGGTALKGSLGATAGEAVKSAVPAITNPIVRNAGVSAYLKSLGVNVARSAAVGGVLGAASGLEQNADTKKLVQSTAIGLLTGGAIPAAGEAVRGVAKAVGWGAQELAQTFSGAPRKAIEYAKANPDIVKQGIRNAVSDEGTAFKVANAANDAATAIKAKRDAAFSKGLTKLGDQLTNQKIDPTPFNETLKSALQKYDVITANGKLNPNSVISDGAELKGIQKILDRMRTQTDLSPNGWWKVKQFVDNMYKPSNSNQYNALITEISNGIRDEMTNNVKGFDKLLSNYSKDSSLLTYLTKELGVKAGARGITAGEDGQFLIQENSKRVITALGRAMKDNQPLAEELLKELQRRGGKQIMGDLAGMYFADALPPKLQSILGLGAGSVLGIVSGAGTVLHAAPLAAFASPRLVGEGAIAAGRITQGLRNVPPSLLEGLNTLGRGTGYAAVRGTTK